MSKIINKLMVFIFCLVIWCLIAWPFNLAKPSVDWQMLIAGIVISLLGTFILGEVFQSHPHSHFFIIRLFWGLLYIPLLFYYMLLANFDVLYRIVHPKRPINPGIVKVKTELKTAIARTVLANSITLTPGTLTVDITDTGYLYVHCINLKTTDMQTNTVRIVSRFEKIIAKIFE